MLPQPILVSYEEINEHTKPCYCFNSTKNTWDDDVVFYQGTMPNYHYKGFKKIIAGIPELPSIDFSALSEEECKNIGRAHSNDEWISELTKDIKDAHTLKTAKLCLRAGFNKAQSLNEKKFSEEDINKIRELLVQGALTDMSCSSAIVEFDLIIKSLSQPKVFDVEVEMDFAHTDHVPGGFEYFPAITNNQIKITRIL